MRCIVRTADGEKNFFNLDRQEKIEKVRIQLAGHFKVEDASRIKLFYLGKVLEDGFTLYDYSVKDNNIILLSIKQDEVVPVKFESPSAVAPPSPKSIVSDSKQSESLPAVLPEIDDAPDCDKCDNKLTTDCRECGCNLCAKKDNEDSLLICDECHYYFHLYCLPIPLTEIPEDNWFCPTCINNDRDQVVHAGEKDKLKRKKDVSRKWDNGGACAGVMKKCTTVKTTHVGPIPGWPVGSLFHRRTHLSESGIHRPPVGGIHGSSKDRAYSIVLAGGYSDDKDFGDSFLYTGSGGRDLSGNRRCNVQSKPQELTKQNLALALTMGTKINPKGDVAKNWKKSSPVRVCRSYKFAKHSKFAPDEGVRYDGLYKLVRYWSEEGEEGFLVWRYEFRRDDPEPAPWTKEGKARAKELGIEFYMPEGYEHKEEPKKKKKKKSLDSDEEEEEEEKVKIKVTPKKAKVFTIPKESLALIKKDLLNIRTWDSILGRTYKNEREFLEDIRGQEFVCPICHDAIEDPVSTRCGHNACQGCLRQSLLNYGNHCPLCRSSLYPDLEGLNEKRVTKELKSISKTLSVNFELVAILKHLIPSYGS